MPRRCVREILSLAALAIAAPACGKGGGGALPVFSNTQAAATTPAGTQHSMISINFTLLDAESDSTDVAVFFSANGGVTWAAATPAFGGPPIVGLATSPTGIAHSFLWDSGADLVATGTVAYGGGITSVGTVNTQVQIQVVPTGGTAGTTGNFTVDNTMERPIGSVTAIFPWSFALVGNSETAEGDLVADAMRTRYGTQLAFQNGWGIRTNLPSPAFLPANLSLRRPEAGYAAGPPYDLVAADVYVMLPFGNKGVTRTVTGTQLYAILEQGVSLYPANNNGFPQISGFNFSFKASNPVGSRVLSVTLTGGAPIANDATVYTFVTNNYINAGGDNYAMLADGQGTIRENMAQIVCDYIQAAGPLTPTIAGRITVVP
ncbi:MAG: 5'-nucleotidase C-terminal domain-containing protein [Planctomycetes bacterium]|nr:5'-nucleotidase C-terminal domain-containing protein [Planctomycetota bacterium]